MFHSAYDTPDERRRHGDFYVNLMNYLLAPEPHKTYKVPVRDITPKEQIIKINKHEKAN